MGECTKVRVSLSGVPGEEGSWKLDLGVGYRVVNLDEAKCYEVLQAVLRHAG